MGDAVGDTDAVGEAVGDAVGDTDAVGEAVGDAVGDTVGEGGAGWLEGEAELAGQPGGGGDERRDASTRPPNSSSYTCGQNLPVTQRRPPQGSTSVGLEGGRVPAAAGAAASRRIV